MTDLDSDEDKLNWIFMAFDQDGGGFIDVKETFFQGAISIWFLFAAGIILTLSITSKSCFSLTEFS